MNRVRCCDFTSKCSTSYSSRGPFHCSMETRMRPRDGNRETYLGLSAEDMRRRQKTNHQPPPWLSHPRQRDALPTPHCWLYDSPRRVRTSAAVVPSPHPTTTKAKASKRWNPNDGDLLHQGGNCGRPFGSVLAWANELARNWRYAVPFVSSE